MAKKEKEGKKTLSFEGELTFTGKVLSFLLYLPIRLPVAKIFPATPRGTCALISSLDGLIS